MHRCRKCGYFDDMHDVVSRQCPLCQCGETPAAHGVEKLCPALCVVCAGGKQPLGEPHEHRPYRIGSTGEPLSLRRGSYEEAIDEPMPIEERVARIVSCIADNLPPVMMAAQLAEPEELIPYRPPMVPARPPYGAQEIAGYARKQAVGLGIRAVAGGWHPNPLYWRSADGIEGCGVWLQRDDLRALATWKRPSAKAGTKSGWATDIAYAWRIGSGQFPTKMTHTELDELLARTIGER